MGQNDFANIRGAGRGTPLGRRQSGLGDLEKQEWERNKTAFTEKPTPTTPQLPERVDDREIPGLAAAVARELQQFRIQEPLRTEDRPPDSLEWNTYDNVGWDAVLGAPASQRVDIGPKNRQYFWCFSVGVPIFAIWIAPGQGVQAAFGAAIGRGIPLIAPSAVGVYDGAAWSCAVGDDIHFYATAPGIGCRLTVVEGVRI